MPKYVIYAQAHDNLGTFYTCFEAFGRGETVGMGSPKLWSGSHANFTVFFCKGECLIETRFDLYSYDYNPSLIR
jgi:hypothetical protein